MIEINDLVDELADDVFIRQSKSMDNNELSIEQLQAINGGGVFAKLDGFRAERMAVGALAQTGDNSFEYLGSIVLANTVREHVRKNAERFSVRF